MSESVASPPPVRKLFRLWPATFVIVIVGLILIPVREGFRTHAELDATTFAILMGKLFGMLVLILFLGLPGILLGRRRPVRGNLLFLAAAVFVLTVQYAASLRSTNDQIMDKVVAESQAETAARLDEAETKGYIDDAAAASKAAADRLEDASRNMTGLDAKVTKASAAIARSLGEYTVPFNEASKAFAEAGALDLAAFKDASDVKARLALLDRVDEASTALLGYLQKLPAETRREMIAAGVPSDRCDNVVAGFLKGANHTTLIAIRHEDTKFVAAARTYLGVLVEHTGNWTIDEEGNAIFAESVPDAALERFRTAAQQIEAVGERQTKLLESLRPK